MLPRLVILFKARREVIFVAAEVDVVDEAGVEEAQASVEDSLVEAIARQMDSIALTHLLVKLIR